MKCHLNSMVRACYGQMRQLSRIRKFLTIEATEKLVHAFITSRLDNLNSLLYNLPNHLLRKLQLVQNNAARLVMRLRRKDHITPILINLHWLPVECRIKYKILLLVFKSLHGEAPAYLDDLIAPYRPSRTLRSGDLHLLTVLPAKRKYGERAFAVCGPRLWNTLPLHVRKCPKLTSFKTALKTHLFKIGYDLE
jgi:hypothetical protein